jgi:isoleucyl-tRNA synthetase
MDKWALSKLNTLIKEVDDGLANYKIFETARNIQDYVDQLSNWYVRRGRERYWGKEMTEDKISAYTTLYTILVTLAKISAPYVPFMAESIYQNLVPNFYKDAPISVHLCDFPVCDESFVDSDLEEGMNDVLEINIYDSEGTLCLTLRDTVKNIANQLVENNTEADNLKPAATLALIQATQNYAASING